MCSLVMPWLLRRYASPLTRQPGGPVDAPVQVIADRLNAKPEQVLLAWAKAKGVVVVTCVLEFHFFLCA